MPQVTRSVEHAGRKPFDTATELFQLVHNTQAIQCSYECAAKGQLFLVLLKGSTS
jgi:hypothetical protein